MAFTLYEQAFLNGSQDSFDKTKTKLLCSDLGLPCWLPENVIVVTFDIIQISLFAEQTIVKAGIQILSKRKVKEILLSLPILSIHF